MGCCGESSKKTKGESVSQNHNNANNNSEKGISNKLAWIIAVVVVGGLLIWLI